jgi:hypothetical protein
MINPSKYIRAMEAIKIGNEVYLRDLDYTQLRCAGTRKSIKWFKWRLDLRCKNKAIVRSFWGDPICLECLYKLGAIIIENKYILVSKPATRNFTLSSEEEKDRALEPFYALPLPEEVSFYIRTQEFGNHDLYLMEMPCDLRCMLSEEVRDCKIRLGRLFFGLDQAENEEQLIEIIRLARQKIHSGEWEAEKTLFAMRQASKNRE